MFGNECLGELQYEGVTAAIVMAGIFVSFLIEYIGYRLVKWQAAKKTQSTEASPSKQAIANLELVSVYVMEAGIIFHSMSKTYLSILPALRLRTLPPTANMPPTRLKVIGVTLVVAGDSFFLTLFVVILFHQMFEGLALGSRIADLGTRAISGLAVLGHHGPSHMHHHAPSLDGSSPEKSAAGIANADTDASASDGSGTYYHVSLAKKIAMGAAFALVTPIGMAIGIGVLQQFNGNDPETIVAIGTLDAFSAGILLWVGVVEMWAADWAHGGPLSDAGLGATCSGLTGLVAGMVVMSVLGKWA